jgi:MFS family permease
VLSTYRDLFQLPGAARIASGGFIARMPIAMDAIAIILFIYSVDKRFALAGALTAVAALTTVISSPLWSKVADRRGQRFVLSIAVPIRIVAIIAFINLVLTGAPIWTWFLSIFIAEAGSISMGSMSRRRWVHIIDNQDKQMLATSYAYESLADELVFILGPIITTAIVTVIDPAAGLILGVLFLLVGVPLILSHRSSDPGPEPHIDGVKPSSVLRNRNLQAIAIPLTVVGGAFSAVNICVVALTTEQNAKAVSGLLLGIWAIGGATSALVNGAIRWKIAHGKRFIGYLSGMALVSLTFPFIENLYLMGFVLFLQGICIAPLLPNGLPLVTHSVPASQMTQAITLATAGIPLTGALSSASAGKIIDLYGASIGFWLPFVFLAASLLSTIPYRKLYREV